MREREDSEERLSEGRDQRLSPAPGKPTKARRGRIWKNVARGVLGLLVGLGITEGAFRARDDGAFPHLNVYVSDAKLGARLRPGATERVRFSSKKNPVTSVRINAEGFRGEEWPAKTDEEVVVVGDSQVFGLGVEEDETFEKEIERQLAAKKVVVRNLGVPTYGPGEYNAVLEEALAKRPAKTVIWVANMANDLFEASRPNKERHVVWDGWAIRTETAPARSLSFPGRGFLYTDSHAVYALRRYLYERDVQGSPSSEAFQGVPSEGTWKDVAGDAAVAAEAHAREEAERKRLVALQASRAKYATDDAERAARELDSKLLRQSYDDYRQSPLYEESYNYEDPNFVPKDQLFDASRMAPGDVVTSHYAESERDVRVTAEIIRRGAALRARVETQVKAEAIARKKRDVLDAFDKRDALAKHAAEIASAPLPLPVPLSPLSRHIEDAKKICDKYGARLVVVALPIDVQVDKSEWAKYGAPPEDMEPTKLLNADVVTAAEYVGAEGFDALPVLAAAEPGAFLDGDIHMTAKGHRALGRALAKLLATPKLARPGDGLPPFRSAFPTEAEWTPDTEIAVTESDPAGCETKRVREWLGIFCRGEHGARGVRVDRGREVTAGAMKGQAVLIAPLFPGQDVRATFAYDHATRGFSATLAKYGDLPDIAFSKPNADAAEGANITGPSPSADAYCACFEKTHAGKTCDSARTAPSATCARTYANDCAKLLACAQGADDAPPACGDLEANAGAIHACTPLCSAALPCAKGACVSWQGGDVCM